MIKNNYLFSSQFLEYLKQQKITDEETFQGFVSTIKNFLQIGIPNDLEALDQRFISAIIPILQFAKPEMEYANSQRTAKHCYLYDGFPLEKKVNCLYLISPEDDLDAAEKGNFPAFDLIHLLKKEKLEWGILTNGKVWRLYSTLATLPYEYYLEINFEDAKEEDYRVFWQLFTLHLFIPDEYDVTPLEKYIDESEKEAEVIEKHIKSNIEEILEKICFGFLSYAGKDKQPLTEKDKKLYFDNAVYLLFRLLFVFYAESRRLLPIDNPEYRKRSLEALLEKARNWEKNGYPDSDGTDLWTQFRDLCNDIDQGNKAFNIPEYDGELFNPFRHKFLSNNKLTNSYFARVLYLLGYRNKRGQEIKIEYKDLSVRSLGSLYEGILEYKLFITEEDKVIRGKKILSAAEAGKIKKTDRVIEKGQVYFSQAANERHDTGSYYTPEDVVNYMVQNSVRLGLEERWMDFLPLARRYEKELREAVTEDIRRGILKKFEKEVLQFIEEKILTFKVMDPAMGSGHFLVNALNTITHFILEVLQQKVFISDGPIKHDKQPLEIDWQLFEHNNPEIELNPVDWRRRVVEKCIFGIDINPLATELAKLSLWIASTAAGKPLTFLNHHLKCGDSIMGIRLQDMLIYPDYGEKSNQIDIFEHIHREDIERIQEKYRRLLARDSDQLQNVMAKKEEYEEIEKDPFLNHLKDVATLWLMISFRINGNNNLFDGDEIDLPDKQTYFDILDKAQAVEEKEKWRHILGDDLYEAIKQFVQEKQVFHWELEFPEIIGCGFDAALGNPPYVDVTKYDYCGVPLGSLLSTNLYAYIPEKAFEHLNKNQRLSFVTPLAISASKRMIHIQKIFRKHSWYLFHVDSSSHPGVLFPSVNAHLNIFVVKKDSGKRIFTTHHTRFYNYERKRLFKHIQYHLLKNENLILDYTIPKISTDIEEKILELLFNEGDDLKKYVSENKNFENAVYYRSANAPYYLYAYEKPPYMEVNGDKVISTSIKSVNFKPEYSKYVILSLLHSSLYYWFWIVYSDCYNFHPKEFYRIPINLEKMSKFHEEFKQLYYEIEHDLDQNSEIVVYKKAKGKTKYKLLRARKSKKVFDKVDRFFGEKIGLSNDMINFLINFDIKYRTDETID